MQQMRWAPYAVLAIGVTAVSWSAVLIREADAPALVIASYRMVLAALPVGTLALIQQRRAPEPISTSSLRPLLLSGAFLALHFAFWITALQHTSVVTAVVLMSMQPLFVGLASPFLLKEAVHRGVWFALLLTLAGSVIMGAGHLTEGFDTLAGDFYALLAGAFAAGYLLVGRRVRPGTSWLRYIGTVYPVTAVLLLAAMFIAGDSPTGYSTKTLLMIALLALGPQLIGHSSINWALGYLPAIIVAIAILVEPVGATILAAIILDEQPTALELIGSLVVLSGVYLALRPVGREAPAPELSPTDG